MKTRSNSWLRQVDASFGLVTGLIHGAGRNVPRAATIATVETAMSEVFAQGARRGQLAGVACRPAAALSDWIDFDHWCHRHSG